MFWSLAQARVVISDWKEDYNHRRRHSALGYQAQAGAAVGAGDDGDGARLVGDLGGGSGHAWMLRRRDVVVAPEQVVGVVAALDLDQAVPGRARVGPVDPLGPFVAEEVDIGALVALLEGGGRTVDPGLAPVAVGGALIERGHVGHDPAA